MSKQITQYPPNSIGNKKLTEMFKKLTLALLLHVVKKQLKLCPARTLQRNLHRQRTVFRMITGHCYVVINESSKFRCSINHAFTS